MLVQAMLAGTALLASFGQALAAKPHGGSHTRCHVSSSSHSSSESAEVAQSIALEVSAALCSASPPEFETFQTAATASATAFAVAIVDITAECSSSGTGSFYVNGHSAAYAEALAIAEAYASAAVEAATCGKCHAAGIAVAQAFQEIFLQATVDIQFTLDGITQDTDLVAALNVVTESIKVVTVDAFAGVMATAFAADEECSGNAVAVAIAGEDGGPLSGAACEINLGAATGAVVSDAIVAVTAETAAKACADLSGVAASTFSVEATAVAKAMAIAMTEVLSGCYVRGSGFGCVAGTTEITKTAKAVAFAFAKGLASATSTCLEGCSVDIAALTDSLAEVLATATSKTIADQCAGPDSFFVYDKVETVIATTYAEAIAKVIVTAIVDAHGNCAASVDITAKIEPVATTTEVIHGRSVPTHPAPAPAHPTPAPTPVHVKAPAPTKKAPHKKVPAHKRRQRKAAKKHNRKPAKKHNRRPAKKHTRKPAKKHNRRAPKKVARKPVKKVHNKRRHSGRARQY